MFIIFIQFTFLTTCTLLVCVFFRYLKDGTSQTEFLTVLPLADGRTDTITDTLIAYLTEEAGLDLDKMCALCSDGASVMVGRENGVAAKLRRRVPHLLNNHCVAHRLALAAAQGAKDISYLQKFKAILGDLHRFYEKSAVRTHALREIQV